jgi:hypothetical protein
MIIPEWLFTLVVLAGVLGSVILLVLLVGYFIYEFRSKQIW